MIDENGLVEHIGYTAGLNVAISICLTYTLIFTCIRIHLRKHNFAADDGVMIFATITALVHFATSYACLTAGLGKPWNMIEQKTIIHLSNVTKANAVTFILSLYASKLAALAFLIRIESKTRNPLLYKVLLILYTLLGLCSIIIVSANCPSSSAATDFFYFDIYGNRDACPGETMRWQIMTALDIVSEVGLLVLPLHLVWPLQMPMSTKAIVVITFWIRLPAIILSALRQSYTSNLDSLHSDKSLTSAVVTSLMCIQLAYTLISNTLSTSKNFTDGFNTGFGMGNIRGVAESYDLSYVVGNGSSSQARTRTSAFLGNGDGDGGKDSGSNVANVDGGNTVGQRSSKMSRIFLARKERKTGYEEQEQEEQGLQFGATVGTETRNTLTVVKAENARGIWSGRTERALSVSLSGISGISGISGLTGVSGVSGEDGEESGILRQTEYEVSHDEVPILRRPDGEHRV